MKDIDRWKICSNEEPPRRGRYLLLVGKPIGNAGYFQTGVIECLWNGKVWDTIEDFAKISWKYIKPGDIDKYPDFEKTIRRPKL